MSNRAPRKGQTISAGSSTVQVFDGMSHAQYPADDRVPETKEAFSEIAEFFDKHLGA